MAVCSRDPSHVYPGHNKKCPWCAAAASTAPAPKQVKLPPVQAPSGAARPAPRTSPSPTTGYRPRAAFPTAVTAPKPTGLGFVAFVLLAFLGTSVTVLIPWLIGTNKLRDGAFRPRSGLVYSAADRVGGDYFLTDYFAGLAVTSCVAGALLIIAALPRTLGRLGRLGRLAIGGGLIALALVVCVPKSASEWASAELGTARTEALGSPTGYRPACGGILSEWQGSAIQLTSDGIVHTWSATPIDYDHDQACTQVRITDGTRLVRIVETPNIRDGIIVGYGGATLEDSRFVFLAKGPLVECSRGACSEYDVIGAINAATGEVEWTHQAQFTYYNSGPGGSGPPDVYYPNAIVRVSQFVVLENPQTLGATATAFDPATGSVLWRAGCPERRTASTFFEDEDGAMQMQCNRTDGSPVGGIIFVEIAEDGTVSPSELGK